MTSSTNFEHVMELPPTLDTKVVGHVLGLTAPSGTLLLLSGPTGSGKTSLAQGVAQGMGISARIVSPTFLYLQSYETEDESVRMGFLHADWDRVSGEPEDLMETLLEGRESRVTLVEWGEKLSSALKNSFSLRLEITIIPQGEGRHLSFAWSSGVSDEEAMLDWKERVLSLMSDLVSNLQKSDQEELPE